MATSGSFKTSAYSNRHLYFYWEVTEQSIANNTTTIYWSLSGAGSASGYYKAGPIKVTIDGETVYSSSSRINLYNNTLVAEGYKTFTHNDSGARSFSAYAEGAIYSASVNCSGTGSWSFEPIPRFAAILTAPNFSDIDNPTITYSNPAGNNLTGLKACISLTGAIDDIHYRDISKTAGRYTFNLTDAERKILRQAVTSGGSVKVHFFVWSTIGGAEKRDYLTVTFSLTDYLPIINPTLKDVGSVTTALTGNPKIMIKNCSIIECAINATARKEATISLTQITNGPYRSSNATAWFEQSPVNEFYFYAQDSRGNSVGKYMYMDGVVDYVPLTCSATYEKELANDNTAKIKINVSGNYFNNTFGAVRNSLQLYYRYKTNSGEYGNWVAVTPTFNGNSYSASVEVTGLGYKDTFTFMCKASDALNVVETNPYPIKIVPVFDWGEDDFSFNVPIAIEGKAVADFITEQGEKDNWTYRKWNSGVCECWKIVTVSTTITGAWGSMFVGDTKMSRQNYPFQYSSKPVEIAQLMCGSNAGWLFPESNGNGVNGGYASAIYNICRPSQVTTAQTFYILLYAKGKL